MSQSDSSASLADVVIKHCPNCGDGVAQTPFCSNCSENLTKAREQIAEHLRTHICVCGVPKVNATRASTPEEIADRIRKGSGCHCYNCGRNLAAPRVTVR